VEKDGSITFSAESLKAEVDVQQQLLGGGQQSRRPLAVRKQT